jgi:hypothetical protein
MFPVEAARPWWQGRYRFHLAAAALVLVAAVAAFPRHAAAEADGPAVEIVGWGIVDRMRTIGTVPSDTLLGRNHVIDPAFNVEIAETTLDIPACPGTRFGILFRATRGAPIVTVQIRHPEQAAPDGRRSTVSRWTTQADTRQRYTGWRFDQPFEMVPGEWTLSLLVDGEVMAEKTFTVRRDPCALTS